MTRAFMVAAAAAALLSACGTTPVPVKPDPIDVHVAPECRQSCTCDAQPSVITSDPYSAPDAAVREHKLRKLCVQKCDTARQGCVDALDRARAADAIK